MRSEVLRENHSTQRSILEGRPELSDASSKFTKATQSTSSPLIWEHIQERVAKARKLYEQHLAGDRWQWVMT
ncbi:hypothetical protein ANN_17753 [Periplaneta americana]|uniref:Uncharacterized protein n=1 Tax=Periplaneta americana TaxID=6978 RepID=A0ABQ8STU0_PERAM|nr:hypothetical protein ANN_17753 [Periplaneta americana]